MSSNASDTPIIITTMEQTITPGQPTQLHQVGKHQMLPVVVIQAQPNQKLHTSSTNSNVLALPQILPMQQVNNQMMLGKTPIVLQKATNLPKNGVTYLTMLKPVSKPPDSVLAASRLPITSITNMGKLTSESTLQVINNQKIMITPMPTTTSTSRLPVTMTTNSVQSKISFMPLMHSVQNKSKIINLKMPENKMVDTDLTITAVPDEKNVEKKPVQDDRSYELSIVEEECEEKDKNDKITSMPPIHGVSILKRSFPLIPKVDPPVTTTDTIITISDPNTKEVHITKSLPDPLPPLAPPQITPEIKEEPINSTPVIAHAPAKRSRKSTLCLRKDFHEIEVQVSTKGATLKKLDLEEENRHDKEVDEINSGADPFNFSSLLDEEFIKVFDWKQSVGKLPGTNLKFFINEFGFLEYLTQDEYNKMHLSKPKKEAIEKVRKQKVKKELSPAEEQEEMRCLECGCFGMASEFINPKYCSLECHALGEKKAVDDAANQKKRPKQTQSQSNASNSANNHGNAAKKRKLENGDRERETHSSDDDASIRTESSYDKYPWHCKTKGFSWSKYLAHINTIGAPVKLFKDAFPYNRNGFRPGMKLEGIDPLHPSYFCVMTVAQVQGYRLLLHFDGYPKNYDFWANADSMDIFPAGFCEKHDHVLQPPPNFPDFNWVSYLKHTKASVAPKHLFSNRTGSAIFPTAFRVGMKLEAVDRKNTALVCVATAKDLMDSRILVHFDSWDDIYDYWADPSSPYIHPVGWCDKNGHSLTPPNDYPNLENFTWEKYLKETNSVAAPVRAFKQRPPSGFRKGMRLEAVDKRVPQLVRVACVVEVKQHRLRVAFDGWPDRYSYWVDEDNPDIHPVGWCQKTGHPLEPPLTPDDVYDFMECATIGCRGIGNMKGQLLSTHNSLKYCPYAEANIDIDTLLPDRLLSPDRELEAIVPVSREPRTKKASKRKYETNAAKTEWIGSAHVEKTEDSPRVASRGSPEIPQTPEDTDAHKLESPSIEFKIKSSNSTPAPSPSASIKSQSISIKKESHSSILGEEELNLEEINMRNKHSKYYKCYAKCKTDPMLWTTMNVMDYVQSLPFAKHNAEAFVEHSIDGESFLMLTQDDLVEVLKYKLGPAIALYNCILFLRKHVNCAT